jgi:DNA-directed RNA polymerase specialized sigma24 family protein
MEQVRAFVSRLTPREQMLVRMHFVEGLAIPEVARSLRMTDNATHVMKSRLRSKLRLALGDLHGDE